MPGRGMGERLVVDPNNNNILYFGARSGHGLWKSTNAGATWSQVTAFPDAGTYVPDPTGKLSPFALDAVLILYLLDSSGELSTLQDNSRMFDEYAQVTIATRSVFRGSHSTRLPRPVLARLGSSSVLRALERVTSTYLQTAEAPVGYRCFCDELLCC
jgi:xyloglucan-specific exo-beta-1,4-glucanase